MDNNLKLKEVESLLKTLPPIELAKLEPGNYLMVASKYISMTAIHRLGELLQYRGVVLVVLRLGEGEEVSLYKVGDNT